MGLICFLIGHQYHIHRKVNECIRELRCSNCKEKWAMNDNLRVLLPLDGELLEIHNEIIAADKIIEQHGKD